MLLPMKGAMKGVYPPTVNLDVLVYDTDDWVLEKTTFNDLCALYLREPRLFSDMVEQKESQAYADATYLDFRSGSMDYYKAFANNGRHKKYGIEIILKPDMNTMFISYKNNIFYTRYTPALPVFNPKNGKVSMKLFGNTLNEVLFAELPKTMSYETAMRKLLLNSEEMRYTGNGHDDVSVSAFRAEV